MKMKRLLLMLLVSCWPLNSAADELQNQLEIELAVAEVRAQRLLGRTQPLQPVMTEASLPASAQPTPWPGVSAMLNAIKPKPDDLVLDPGCGFDARLLIEACRYFDVQKAIGVEIDPEIAESARQHVCQSGLGDRIEIINGDSTKLDIDADIVLAYLYPETLKSLLPTFERAKRIATYEFAVPGLRMETKATAGGGKFHIWRQAAKQRRSTRRTAITRTVRRVVNLPRGSPCQICGRRCSAPMTHKLERQTVGYANEPAEPPKPAATQPKPQQQAVVVRQSNCPNGQCPTSARVRRRGLFGGRFRR